MIYVVKIRGRNCRFSSWLLLTRDGYHQNLNRFSIILLTTSDFRCESDLICWVKFSDFLLGIPKLSGFSQIMWIPSSHPCFSTSYPGRSRIGNQKSQKSWVKSSRNLQKTDSDCREINQVFLQNARTYVNI